MSENKFTPGPWFADTHGRIWRRDPKDLYENGGKVAGDKPLAVVHIGWLGENVQGYPLQANARLIAAAPELFAEVEREYTELADIHNSWPGRDTPAGQHKLGRLRDLIAKATGRDPQAVQDDYGMRAAKARDQS